MAGLVFPDAPSPGEVFESWQWDGSKWMPAPGFGGPIVGVTDGSNAAPGDVGEYILTGRSDLAQFADAGWIIALTLLVQPGDWDMQAYSYGTTNTSNFAIMLDDTENPTPGTGWPPVNNPFAGGQFNAGPGNNSVQTGIVRYSLAVPTVISLHWLWTAQTPVEAYAAMQGRRVR